MREVKHADRSRLIQAAMQKIPCDLTVENVQFVNMYTGEVYPASVDVLDGRVVRIREGGQDGGPKAHTVYDGKGAFLVPGFIDTHMHVESTMMIPEIFGQTVLPWGTTTVCSDPHEIANVMGVPGVEFMLKNAQNSKLRHYILAPSCVPSVPEFENAGAVFGAREVGQLLDMPGVVGIAEIMDTAGVFNDTERMHSIIDEGIRRGAFLQGHAPGTMGKELTAYRLGGPCSDHESYNGDDVRAKLRAGIHINLRASSISNTLESLIEGFKDHKWHDLVSVCTDDVYAKDIMKKGHVSDVVGQMIAYGVDPIVAYKMASCNAAREYGLHDLGIVAPGFIADMQLVEKLDGGQPKAVFIAGELVAENGACVGEFTPSKLDDFPNTVNAPQIKSVADFRLKAPEGCGDSVKVNVIRRGGDMVHLNERVELTLPVKDGYVCIDEHPDLIFVCVANRYGTGDTQICLYQDFGLKSGAFATTVSHDSHNLTVAYRRAEDALVAARALMDCGGGMCVVSQEKLTGLLKLPIAGLMSPLPTEALVEEIDALDRAYHQLRDDKQSIMKAVTLSLPCTPRMVVTDLGLVDGTAQKFVDLFPA